MGCYFFCKDVCGWEEVDLRVKLRKTGQRAPVILSKTELIGLIGKLEEHYKIPALLQYGAGLRLQKRVELRIKDVDVERGVVTFRSRKGNKDRKRLFRTA